MTRLIALPLVLLLAACATTPSPDTSSGPVSAADAFFATLETQCGKAYAGRLVSNDPRDADWAGKRMIAHWADCHDSGQRDGNEDSVSIALHIEDASEPDGWNRSRTWIVDRKVLYLSSRDQGATVLTLSHDHRHRDGTQDTVTQYGGNSFGLGGATAQSFPVSEQSIALFEREGLTASTTNVWRMEVDPATHPAPRFAYQLTRANDPTRIFRAEFDLSTPVAAPPPAWGHGARGSAE